MCKAINYAKELNEVYYKIKNDCYSLREKIAESNKIQLDIAHYIETYDLSEEELLDITKRFQDLRRARRKMKNELELLDELWRRIEPFQSYTKINTEVIPVIKKREEEIIENWKYRFRSNYFTKKGSTLTRQQVEIENQSRKNMTYTAIVIRPNYDFILVD